MFWRFGGYANISTIDTILDKPEFTLEELLDLATAGIADITAAQHKALAA